MTPISQRLKELPEMPKPNPMFPMVEPYRTNGVLNYKDEQINALRARLSLALEVLANSPCSCFYEFRESGEDNKNICDRCATLEAMKELR